jgi:hypothetical protein
MEAWNKIIHTAMMGTDKKMIGTEELSSTLAEATAVITENTTIDKEEKFLQLASLTYNYRQCAVLPLKKETITIEQAPAEEKQYCDPAAMQVLKDILFEESQSLLQLWLTACAKANRLVSPEMIPSLFAIGKQYKQLRAAIAPCTGKRGEWLCQFNHEWNFSVSQSQEELWNTGTTDQRKVVLTELRSADPAAARALLEQTWAQEDAATKVSFLEILSINVSNDDLVFLESLQNEKSKKVKEEALKLLKQIPSSALVQQYMNVLQKAVTIKTEKALLGMMSKTSLSFQVPADIDPVIFKSGIEKLSSNSKEFSDDEFIIYQLIQFVPPTFWEQQLGKSPQQIIELFEKDTTGKKMITALVLATLQFKQHQWAVFMMQYCSTFYIDLIPMLPAQQQEYYSNRSFADHADAIIRYAVEFKREWSIEMTRKILTHASNNPYHYTRSFFSQHIALIPSAIERELGLIIPAEEYQRNSWNKTKEYLAKLINLKNQITTSFTA